MNKKLLPLISSLLFVATTAFAVGNQSAKSSRGFGVAGQMGTGNSTPERRVIPDSSNRGASENACFERIAYSVTPTMLTGSITGGPQSNTDWIDTTPWNDLVLDMHFGNSLASATIVVETTNTITGGLTDSTTPFMFGSAFPQPTILGIYYGPGTGGVNSIYNAGAGSDGVVAHITGLGKFTRIRIISNGDGAGTAPNLGFKTCGTISIGALFRR